MAQAFVRSDPFGWPLAPAAALNACMLNGAGGIADVWLDVHAGGAAAATPVSICIEIHTAGWSHVNCNGAAGAACLQCVAAVAAGAPALPNAGFRMGTSHVGLEPWGAARSANAVNMGLREAQWEPSIVNSGAIGLTGVQRLPPPGGFGTAWTNADLQRLRPHPMGAAGAHPWLGYQEIFVPVATMHAAQGITTQTPLSRSVGQSYALIEHAHPSPFRASTMQRALTLVNGMASASVHGLNDHAAIRAFTGVESATVAAIGGSSRSQPDLVLQQIPCSVHRVTGLRSVGEIDAGGAVQLLRVRVEEGCMYCPFGERRRFRIGATTAAGFVAASPHVGNVEAHRAFIHRARPACQVMFSERGISSIECNITIMRTHAQERLALVLLHPPTLLCVACATARTATPTRRALRPRQLCMHITSLATRAVLRGPFSARMLRARGKAPHPLSYRSIA